MNSVYINNKKKKIEIKEKRLKDQLMESQRRSTELEENIKNGEDIEETQEALRKIKSREELISTNLRDEGMDMPYIP